MRKCKSCGTEYEKKQELCPKCGIGPGPQTITDMPSANIKGNRAELISDIKDAGDRESKVEAASCKSCGTPVSHGDEWCPDCGKGGGSQTITDMPRVNLKEAHKKLKEDIKEAREHKE